MSGKFELRKSHLHNITPQEEKIDSILNVNDELIFKIIDIYENYNNEIYKKLDKTNETELSEWNKANEKMFHLIFSHIKLALNDILDIFNEWFNTDKIFNYFNKVLAEPLYLLQHIYLKINELTQNGVPDKINFKVIEYYFIQDISKNISSCLDKISYSFFYANFPRSSIKVNDNFIKHLYFNNFDKKLEEILREKISDPLINFKNKIIEKNIEKNNIKKTEIFLNIDHLALIWLSLHI